MQKCSAYALNHRISIQRDISADSDSTSSAPAYEDICSVWANERGLTGTLLFSAETANQTGDIRFIIRHRTDLAGAVRIVEGSKNANGTYAHEYRIWAAPVDVDGKRQWLEIHAKETLQNGG